MVMWGQGELQVQEWPQMPQAPPTGAVGGSRSGTPTPNPTSTVASPGSTSPGERAKLAGTWAARGGANRGSESDGNDNSNTKHTIEKNEMDKITIKQIGIEKANDPFILPDQSNDVSQENPN